MSIMAGTRSGLDLNAVPNLKLGRAYRRWMKKKCTAIDTGSRPGKTDGNQSTEAVSESWWKTGDSGMRCMQFENSPVINDIILVTGAESVEYCQREIVEKY